MGSLNINCPINYINNDTDKVILRNSLGTSMVAVENAQNLSLVAHSKRKSDGKVLHPEGERISYIPGKFGLEVTNTGIVIDKEEKEAPTAEVAAEAE